MSTRGSTRAFLSAVLGLALAGAWGAAPAAGDPHRDGVGFFDIHVCHWPDRPLFFLALYSTTRYAELAEIALRTPSGKPLGKLDLARYRLVLKPGAPEKRVFITQIQVPAAPEEGWYVAETRLKGGQVLSSRDFVRIADMPMATGMQPPDKAENVPLPQALTWSPIPGAKFYQVFIKDLWDGEKLILQSELLPQPRLILPEGLLKPGGSYAWRVHSRDLNEDPLWGDFNHGSLGPEFSFSVAD